MIRSLIAILASPSATPATLILVSSKRQALALDYRAPRSAHAGWRSELSRGTTPTDAAMPARHVVGGIYQLIDIDSFSARVVSAAWLPGPGRKEPRACSIKSNTSVQRTWATSSPSAG